MARVQEAMPCFWQLVPPSEANTPEANPIAEAEAQEASNGPASNGAPTGAGQSKERAAAAA